MRAAWLSLALLPAACGVSDELRYAPAPGTILERHVDLATDTEVRRDDTTIDGRTDPASAMRLASLNRAFPGTHETWRIDDEIVAIDEHGPRELIRTFRSLEGVSFATPLMKQSWHGAGDGVVLRLRADDAPADRADPVERLLAGSVPFDLDGAGLLPRGAVAPGDAWDVRVEDLPFARRVVDVEALRDVAIHCRLVERTGDVAVLAFEYAHAVRADDPVSPGATDWVDGKEIELEAREETDTYTGRGELRWNVARAIPAGFSAELAIVTTRHVVGRTPRKGRDVPVEHRSELAVITRLETSVAERPR